MAKQKHYVYLSARKIDPGQVPEGFTVFNIFSSYGLLQYDQPLSKSVMRDYALVDISGLPKPFLKDLGAFI